MQARAAIEKHVDAKPHLWVGILVTKLELGDQDSGST
jgi:hypothetical protein